MPADCVPGVLPPPVPSSGLPSALAVPAVMPWSPTAPWVRRLEADLGRLDQAGGARIGVVVRDLETGQSASHGVDQAWYLASTVKVPVAITVLRAVERGDFTLDTVLTLRAGDVVDGAGPTNSHRPGKALSVRYLIEQMIVHSDNTASDMLIGLVGVQAVNAFVQARVPGGFGPITSLADVRRHTYAQLTPAALGLSGRDFITLRDEPSDCARVRMLSSLVQVPVPQLAPTRLGSAYAAYYASGLNSGRLDAYADLLQALAEGQALDAGHTAYLLAMMERLQTGQRRIKAGLPAGLRFAHKTGTQRERSCDAGLLTVPRGAALPQRIVVVACTRGEASVTRSDRLLRQVGEAICQSGLITVGASRATSCPVVPRVLPGPGPAER
jgi:beta-lactamase class A